MNYFWLSVLFFLIISKGDEFVTTHFPYLLKHIYLTIVSNIKGGIFKITGHRLDDLSLYAMMALSLIPISKIIIKIKEIRKKRNLNEIDHLIRIKVLATQDAKIVNTNKRAVIPNHFSLNRRKLRAKLSEINIAMGNRQYNHIKIKGKNIVLTKRNFDPPKKIEQGKIDELYIGRSTEGDILSKVFSILLIGQTGSGKTAQMISLMLSHLKNRPDALIYIFDWKKEDDFDFFIDNKQVVIIPCQEIEEMRKASKLLQELIDNKNSSKITLLVLDEIQQYLNSKITSIPEKKEIIDSLITSVETILATFRSTNRKVILATQRGQKDLGINFSNCQGIMAGIIDTSMEKTIRPGLEEEDEDCFGEGVWSLTLPELQKARIVKTYYGEEHEKKKV